MLHHFDGFPNNAPPMAILSAMINALGCFQPEIMQPEDNDHFMEPAARLMSKVRTIAAASYRKSIGRPVNYPRTELRYTANFLHMMFSLPAQALSARRSRRAGARPAAAAARRPRAELLDVDGPHGRLVAGEPVRVGGCRRLRALGPVARRRERRRHRDARRSFRTAARSSIPSSRASRTRTRMPGSWASATASTRTSTRAPGSSRTRATRC